MLRSWARWTIRSRSSAETIDPAGFEGELRMMALVLGVTRRSIASAVMRKFSASFVSRKTTLPPAYWMMSLKLTQ